MDEFFESHLVLESLSTRDCSAALGYPGWVVTTIGQLWPEHYGGTRPRISWPTSPTRMDAEAAAHFALFLSVFPPEASCEHWTATPRGRKC